MSKHSGSGAIVLETTMIGALASGSYTTSSSPTTKPYGSIWVGYDIQSGTVPDITTSTALSTYHYDSEREYSPHHFPSCRTVQVKGGETKRA